MPFQFEKHDHESLARPPLREVICQIQFPPILRIGERPPADFQERVRSRFPDFDTLQTFIPDVAGGMQGTPEAPRTVPSVYRFINAAKDAFISLSFNFFAYSTSHYPGWDAFAEELRFAISAVEDIYRPGTATRVGLRYVDFLNTTTTGYQDFDRILNMVNPELTSIFRMPAFPVTEGLARIVNAEDNLRLSLVFGIVLEEPGLRSFVLDFDRFEERSRPFKVDDLMQLCDEFHQTSYNAFRWSMISDSLTVFK